MQCNGEHSTPPCEDAECWRKDERDLVDTITWRRLRGILLDAVTECDDSSELIAFISKHWNAHTPRQFYIHTLEQKIRVLENRLKWLEEPKC